MQDLKARIKGVLVETLFLQDVQPAAIGDGDNLQETLNIDSVALFQVVAGLEEAFCIRLEDSDFDAERFSTVTGIAEVVAAKLGAPDSNLGSGLPPSRANGVPPRTRGEEHAPGASMA